MVCNAHYVPTIVKENEDAQYDIKSAQKNFCRKDRLLFQKCCTC